MVKGRGVVALKQTSGFVSYCRWVMFNISFTLVCLNFTNEAIKPPVKMEEGISV